MNEILTEPIRCSGCTKGIDMCKTRPCWGTPDDVEKLIAADHAKSLMLDYWCGDGPNGDDVEIVAPAIVGDEGDYASSVPRGRCTFLTEEEKCGVYDQQPTEGAQACCKVSKNDLHRQVAMSWNNEQGRELVARWKKLVGLNYGRPEPEMGDIFSMGMLG